MIRAVVVAALAIALIASGAAASAAAAGEPVADDAPTFGRPYPGDPDAEARLVAGEERRLIDIRAAIDAASAEGRVLSKPFRLSTPGIATVVLVGRAAPYTFEELARIAPQSVATQPDGSYLLNEHLYVGAGATLRLDSKDGQELLLRSDGTGFATVVADGGTLELQGTSRFPLRIRSWDGDGPDTRTADGRAYLRIIGGHAEIVNAEVDDLGFWSGVTGGIGLTGTIVPDGLVTADDEAPVEVEVEGAEPLDGGAGDDAAADGESLETFALNGDVEASEYASALIQSVVVRGNAFGIFVTDADRVEIRDAQVRASLVDGIVFHRDVTNSTVVRTTAAGNAQDGFNLTRATESVVFDGLTARDNGRNGITIEGRPLVDGPSATGIPVTVYGDNEVRNSTSSDNGRYGIEVVGGTRVVVTGNLVERNQMGIVVTSGATGISVTANEVRDSESQGIALRDAGTDAEVVENVVDGAPIGVFVRDAGGRFEDNRVQEATNHGIALVGETGASVVTGNAISGSGPSAIDVYRTSGTAVWDNDVADWRGTKPLSVVLRSIFQPLTVLWIAIGLALVLTLGMTRRRRRQVDPYADQAPLSSFTRGIVAREELAPRDADERADEHEFEHTPVGAAAG